MPPSLLKSPTPIFPLIPSLPLPLLPLIQIPSKPHQFPPLKFSKKLSSLPLFASPSPYSYSLQNSEQENEDEEHVIGDCLVFEEGIFEDPFLEDTFKQKPEKPQNPRTKKPNKPIPVYTETLVPEEWKEAQAEINMTKKEKRIIAREMQFGTRVEKKKVIPLPDQEEYLSYRKLKLSQLNPVVLDEPEYPAEEEGKGLIGDFGDGGGELGFSSSGRVMPRNPRLGVADRTLEDVAELFNSRDYELEEDGSKKSQGPQKLFAKEEKVLLNKRTPSLEDATSSKWLPLHTFAASGEFYLLDMLLKHNVDINATDKDGLTALHKAILCRKQAITNYLLRESANPFVRDKDGWTPLHLAVQTQRTDMVRLLLIKGADKTLTNRDGLTPLDLCLYSGRDMRTYELIKLLKELPKSRQLL
ncbi:ankyrin repeat protein isoform X2 [Tasmannia lanceolata]|uniref:ankyrin repeat protein isoform X2 n=1 Tax=Tasmannia lanceolata TaxID=3420 RepID=UPI0040635A1E